MLNKFIETPIKFDYKQPNKEELIWLSKYSKPTSLEQISRIKSLHSYKEMGIKGAKDIMFLREALILKLNQLLDILPHEYSFLVFDAFRTTETQMALFNNIYEKQKILNPSLSHSELYSLTSEFVAHPNEKSRFAISPHNSGGAIDLTLSLNGQLLDMGTEFDETTLLSNTNWFEQDFTPKYGITKEKWFEIRFNRRLLFNLMKSVGFVNYSVEWYHYDLGDCFWASTHELEWFYPSMEAEKSDVISKLAAQVAHDIRSPLAALEMLLQYLEQVPEEKRILIRSALARIKDIANNLLEQNKKEFKGTLECESSKSIYIETQDVYLLSSLIESIVSEKRMQYRSKIGIEIDFKMNQESYGLFASVQAMEFKSVISNLINNAVDVLNETGRITIILVDEKNLVKVIVQDNGHGISPEILSQLGKRGKSYGKQNGSGLGLYHAQEALGAWSGALDIVSEVKKGTSIIISLPKVEAPKWFLPFLEINFEVPIIILDDDASIHQVWKERFESHHAFKNNKTQLFHFSTPNEFREWVKNASENDRKNAVYLCDFELLCFKETGLDLLEELEDAKQKNLVTSRIEEKEIRERCERLEIKLIPKGLAAYIPISHKISTEGYDAILLDDDSLIHLVWDMAATQYGKKLKGFITPEQFLTNLSAYDLSTPVYIDSILGKGIKGEIIAQKVYNFGFKTVYIATGYQPEDFPPMPWVKAIVGKEPPWSNER